MKMSPEKKFSHFLPTDIERVKYIGTIGEEIDSIEKLEPAERKQFRKIESWTRPDEMPWIPKHKKDKYRAMCTWNNGAKTMVMSFDNLEAMQRIWDSYANGWAVELNFYVGDPISITETKPGDN